MNFKVLSIFTLSLLLISCELSTTKKSKKLDLDLRNKYSNRGFALIYDDNLSNIKKLETRSLNIYHKSLKKKWMVKITNPKNKRYLIAEVKSNKENFSNFYNSVLSNRIAETLELDLLEPYIEIVLISSDNTFVAKKAKTFDEERNVAEKAPIDGILINDLNKKKDSKFKIENQKFSYLIKIADFYYEETAYLMKNRITKETNLKDLKITKLSKTKFRVSLGPYSDIKSLKSSFEKMELFNFENLEILKND